MFKNIQLDMLESEAQTFCILSSGSKADFLCVICRLSLSVDLTVRASKWSHLWEVADQIFSLIWAVLLAESGEFSLEPLLEMLDGAQLQSYWVREKSSLWDRVWHRCDVVSGVSVCCRLWETQDIPNMYEVLMKFSSFCVGMQNITNNYSFFGPLRRVGLLKKWFLSI